MKLFSKLLSKNEAPQSKDEWIAVYLKLSNDNYGTDTERASIHEFTSILDKVIKESGQGFFDGDEFGEGEASLYMYGPNADKLFKVVEPLLRNWEPLKGGYAIKRYGAPVDQRERVQF